MPRYPIDEDDDEHAAPYDADYENEFAEDGDWVAGEDDELVDDYDELDDEILTVECPACGAEVIADVGKCPCCGEYLDEVPQGWQGKSWGWKAIGLLGILAVILTSVFTYCGF